MSSARFRVSLSSMSPRAVRCPLPSQPRPAGICSPVQAFSLCLLSESNFVGLKSLAASSAISARGLQLPNCLRNLLDRRSIGLAVAAIDVSHRSVSVDDQRSRMRNVDRIFSEPVIKAVCLGHGAVLIEQKRKRDRMLFQKLHRLEHAVALLSGDKNHLCPSPFEFAL